MKALSISFNVWSLKREDDKNVGCFLHGSAAETTQLDEKALLGIVMVTNSTERVHEVRPAVCCLAFRRHFGPDILLIRTGGIQDAHLVTVLTKVATYNVDAFCDTIYHCTCTIAWVREGAAWGASLPLTCVGACRKTVVFLTISKISHLNIILN